MEPQLSSPHHEKLFIGVVLGLLLGGGFGFYAGWIIGQTQGIASESMRQQLPAPHASAQAQANPLQDVKSSPLDGVKLNPFE